MRTIHYKTLKGFMRANGIRFDPFVPKNLNDGYDFTDLGYLDAVIFEGTRNFWNAAQRLVAFMPYIVDRV